MNNLSLSDFTITTASILAATKKADPKLTKYIIGASLSILMLKVIKCNSSDEFQALIDEVEDITAPLADMIRRESPNVDDIIEKARQDSKN